jgi:hypothetical protein
MTYAPRRTWRRAGLLVLALIGSTFFSASSQAAPPFCNIDLTTAPNCYVAVDDGTVIALSVRVPADCRSLARACPTIFEMAGYENGSAEGLTTLGEFGGSGAPLSRDSRQLTEMFDGDFATVHASVRGTGCSGGEFDLFSLRRARDGAWIIDSWIAEQDWSDRQVGIMGHSYSGITGFMIASQAPKALRAVTVSGLIDDLYRGITYIGGVSNMGFPPLWTLGVRQAYDYLGGLLQGAGRPVWRNVPALNPYNRTYDTAGQSGQCAANMQTRGRTVVNDPVVQGGLGDTDNTWWQARALATFAHRINVPIHIAGAYQDEQTGPRGTARLWEMIDPSVPKRLLIGNGSHGTNQSGYVMRDRRAWMDFWMRGEGPDPGFHSVQVLQEFSRGGPNSVISDTQYPLAATRWTDYYFHANGTLSTATPGAESPDSYESGSGRQGWFWETGPEFGAPYTTRDGPDELTYLTAPLNQDLSIAGPITASLYLSSTAPDTELFVQLIDQAPSGARMYLQRGLLRASHRAIDRDRSDCVDPSSNAKVECAQAGALMYRPHRPHTNPTSVTPGEPVEYLVEIFPVGHVFRVEHRIMVKVMAPPKVESYYAYVARTPPAVNQLLHDADHPSRITLPVIPNAPVGEALSECSLDTVRCIRRPNG